MIASLIKHVIVLECLFAHIFLSITLDHCRHKGQRNHPKNYFTSSPDIMNASLPHYIISSKYFNNLNRTWVFLARTKRLTARNAEWSFECTEVPCRLIDGKGFTYYIFIHSVLYLFYICAWIVFLF